ncbi:aromatic ring-hydroxylating oxygenase subunit alpha [Alicyclobacillus dauci]|uniref:Rieske 2Fe-2S domain-containing protein n=1 Tax=Alicyclobacillus dauci TaxID=1475485 RepID=A0ABY6Z5G1_9BACL|nr:Rieske 2Fe-2S domain-containing protein [Alicyclobacillus dauci]WAH37990.1 Rieske 2Fe-2S domain-containing protein [Alicyclobacillus dauci]
MEARQYIIDDSDKGMFKVHRSVLVQPEILTQERKKIFDRCWLYVGHVSEVKQPGDFKTRNVGGRPIIFTRGSDGEVRAFLNSCTHRGTLVCRERQGNAKSFQCFYHAWTFNNCGELVAVPGQDAYGQNFDKRELGLRSVPRFDHYKGFYFLSFDKSAVSLDEYLAGAKEYLDLIVDQSPTGELQIIQGTQEYDMLGNWKLLSENSFDDYHVAPTHITYLEYLKDSGVDVSMPKGLLMPKHGFGKSLGNGHAMIENETYRGRPIARWMPMYGEEAKEEIAQIRRELTQRLGEQRAMRVAETNRNLLIFPNLVINDGSSVTVRTYFPVTEKHMKITAWAIGPTDESPRARARRLDSFLTFYGPGGFATPDDVEALEVVQQGIATWQELEWSDLSRGMMKKDEDQLNTDELHLRTFWRRWNELMTKE